MTKLFEVAEDLINIGAMFTDIQLEAATIAARQTLSLIQYRVVGSGEDSKGKQFDKYSDNPIPDFFLQYAKRSDESNKKTIKKIKKALGVDAISYEDWREGLGLQTKHRDFKLTGEMWRNITVNMSTVGVKAVASFEAINDEIQRRIDYNIERSGNFLSPNESELERAKELFNTEVARLMGFNS